MNNRIFRLITAAVIFLTVTGLSAGEVVSVLYFENLRQEKENQWISKGIADSLISELSGVDGLILVEREELQKVMEEQQLALSGLTSEEGAAELGRILSARYLVTGSFAVVGKQIQVNCRITDTSSARIEGSTTETIPFKSLPGIHLQLADFVCGTLNYPYRIVESDSPSLTAMEHYYRGIELYDRKQYEEAASFLERAIGEEPTYTGPRKTLESCYTFLRDFKRARQTREIQQLAELLKGLQRRLLHRPFLTYSDMVREAAERGASPEQISGILENNPALVRGNTPAEVLWNIQIVMGEIACKSISYFNDTDTARKMYRQIIEVSRKADEKLKEDPFLPEIVYQELLARVFLEEWKEVKLVCEKIMLGWPDFRMNYAVEEYYQRALEQKDF